MTAKKTQLVAPKAPRLPSPRDEYSADQLDQLNNSLRGYFTQVDTATSTLLGPTGARFLDFPYAILYQNADQTAPDTTTAVAVKFPTEQEGTGVSVVSETRLTVDHPGLYVFSFLLQLKNVDTVNRDVYFWMRKNGVDVANTAHRITAVVGYSRPSIDFTLQLEQDDYVQLMWNTTDIDVSLGYTAAQTSPVAIPAIPASYVSVQFMSAVNSSSTDIFIPPAPPPPIPTPAPPPPTPGPAPTPAPPPPAPLGTDGDVQAIFSTLGAGNRTWYYPLTTADRIALADGTGGTVTADGKEVGRLVDHSGNTFHLNWPTLTDRPLWKTATTPNYLNVYAHPSTINLGGSTTGFTAAFAVKFNSGTYTTLFSDVSGAAASATNGMYLRWNGDTNVKTLTFSVGTGSNRVSVSQSGLIDGASAERYVIIVWFDSAAGSINMKVNDLPTVTAPCSSISAGQSGLQVFSNPFADFSLGGWEGWDHLYGSFYGGLVFKNTTLSATDRNTLRYWLGRQAEVTLAGSTPAPTPAPPPPSPPPPPPPSSGPPTITSIARHPKDMLKIGNFYIEDNRWGASSAGIAEGTAAWQYQQRVERSTTLGANGEIAFQFQWYWPQFQQNGTEYDHLSHEVKGYPSAIYGAKPGYSSGSTPYPAQDFAVRLPDGVTVPSAPPGVPPQVASNWQPAGGSVSNAIPAGSTGGVLPLQQPLQSLQAQLRYLQKTTPNGVGHLSFDIWLTETQPQAAGFVNSSITHEIMIPITNWGTYGNPHTQGGTWSRDSRFYSHDAVIGGTTYKVYATGTNGRLEYNFSNGTLNGSYTNEETGQPRTGWKFICYVPATLGTTGHPTDANGLIHVDIAGILADIRAHSDSRGIRWSRGIEYVASVELGAEFVYGAGDIEVYDYNVTANALPPAPPPPPASDPGAFPSKVLGLYWVGWDNFNVKNTSTDANVVYLFNARPNSDGSFFWPWPNWPSAVDVQAVRTRGQRVILTLGGAGFAFPFQNRTQSTNCFNSIKRMITAFGGVDGVDFNTFEKNPNTVPAEMVWIAQQLKATYGSNFAITAPPGAINTGGAPVNGIAMDNPADLNLMGALADAGVLTYAAPQYYDWSFYNQVNTIRLVNDQWVARLGADKVVLGLSANYANGPSLADCTREWDACVAKYPTQRGAMAWNAQTNSSGGNVWASTMKARVGASTAPPPPPPPPPPAPGGSPYYPFGSRLDLTNRTSYPYGIMPTNYIQTELDGRVITVYNQWKNLILKKSPTFVGGAGLFNGQTITDGYHVQFPNEGTRSEGMGYGMLITVVMAGYDPNAKAYFDGMYKVVRGRTAYGLGDQYLMEWRLAADMSSLGEGWNAMDGDMDIALALLMADRQWGSGGAINYKAQAINTINSLKARNFNVGGLPYLPQNLSRTSDFMVGHFRAYKTATADTFWDTARTACLTSIQNIITNYSPTAKLVPDFIYQPLTTPQPSPGYKIEGAYEGHYAWNACRCPWRWGEDYLYSGDASWKAIVKDLTTFLRTDCNSDPFQSRDEWALDGTAVRTNRYLAHNVQGPLMVGAMMDAGFQSFLNTQFTTHSNNPATTYYNLELQLLPLIVASGNWWRP